MKKSQKDKKQFLRYKQIEAWSSMKSGAFFIALGVIGSILSRMGVMPPLWAWSLAFVVAGAGLKTILDLVMIHNEMKGAIKK